MSRRVEGADRGRIRVAGLVGNANELDTLVRAVTIVGYSSVIRRLVRHHFELCDTCRLPVARINGGRPPHLHDQSHVPGRATSKKRRRNAARKRDSRVRRSQF